MITDAAGGPLGVVVVAANINDHQVLRATIEAIIVERPDAQQGAQHLCLDKGYDNRESREVAVQARYHPHIRSRGEEQRMTRRHKRFKPRRWVVERTLAWLNRCRAILVRYAKKATNYAALIQLDCCLLWYRRLRRLKRQSGF